MKKKAKYKALTPAQHRAQIRADLAQARKDTARARVDLANAAKTKNAKTAATDRLDAKHDLARAAKDRAKTRPVTAKKARIAAARKKRVVKHTAKGKTKHTTAKTSRKKVTTRQARTPAKVNARTARAARKPNARAVRAKTRATLGGQCAWLAFGLRKPWWHLGPAKLSHVAKRAGYAPAVFWGDARVVGLQFTDGYHAARVLKEYQSHIMVDLWGEPTIILKDDAVEVYHDCRRSE